MWRGTGRTGTFLSPSVSAVVVMVSSTQAVVVVVAIAVVVVALLPETATGTPQQKSKRRKLSPYPLRKTYVPLEGLPPPPSPLLLVWLRWRRLLQEQEGRVEAHPQNRGDSNNVILDSASSLMRTPAPQGGPFRLWSRRGWFIL
ncbi:uncharacterized protein LOC127003748 isoform X3 [Eriocheir sinensis]|uniref:uncharacterized protein LOC127003748 isoform X1 n=1 Tax=Eriocheir sinensis TaxID=95602 RepID=UPI0021CA2DAE|nr:uncharacterized protein LOC127003748 isoform X1 [Eriocheir sinensis]XP_050726697.1 uncharacterized protein LOC127003748 isoform X2 [Eriocheir sinensis]XP_050726698.1 uncharacterized protein LOC127003748 isoform X3 [Eriocheir sinensis]